MTPQQLLRFSLIAMGILVVVFLIISLNLELRARENFRSAEDDFHAGDLQRAILQYDATIRNYSLLNFRVSRSRDRLLQIARQQQQAAALKDALGTYRALLSALAAVETGFSPNRALLRNIEINVSQLEKTVMH
jgi:hypothetical protein